MRTCTIVVAVTLLFAAGCKKNEDGELSGPNVPNLPRIPNLPDPEDIVVCDGQTLAELRSGNDLSEGCRDEVRALLPPAQTNFEDAIAVLGSGIDASDGSRIVLLHGVDGRGQAIAASAFADASVRASADDAGVESVQIEVQIVADLDLALLSITVVNDYSASMLEQDLDTVARIERDLFEILPPVYEAEVSVFSEQITLQQAYTENEAAVLSAVARDNSIARSTTALYDGMGEALARLTERTRPARLLIVSTDGRENASTLHEKAELIDAIADSGVAVLMLGALFADVDEMRELVGPRGFYFYTPLYDELRETLDGYLASLRQLVLVRIPPEHADSPLEIDVAGKSLTIEP